jgi:hypothetical protein
MERDRRTESEERELRGGYDTKSSCAMRVAETVLQIHTNIATLATK